MAQFLNDHIGQIVRETPARFIGLGTVPLQDTQLAIDELRRCMTTLSLAGVQIGSHFAGKNLESPELEPFWSEVEALGAAVFIHPWYMSEDARLSKHWFQWTLGMPHETAVAAASLAFGGVFERHPRLKVCLAHGGGSFPTLLGRLTHGFDVRPDLCQQCCQQRPTSFLRQMYLDSLVHDADMLKYIVSKFGSDRVIMGTDYPFPLGEIDCPGGLIQEVYGGDEEVLNNLMWNNAVEFLGIKTNTTPS